MRKRCVEESLVLPVRFLVDQGFAPGKVRRGSLVVSSETGCLVVAGRFDTRRKGFYCLRLGYAVPKARAIRAVCR